MPSLTSSADSTTRLRHTRKPAMPSDARPLAATSHFRLLLACVVANLGGLLVGLQLALFSGILEMRGFTAAMAPAPVGAPEKSLVTSALIFGMMGGAIPAGPICDKSGRRPALLLTAALFLVASLIMATSTRILHLVVGRCLAGVAYALANVVCPMYSAELAPPRLRGAIVNLYQLSITIGIVLAQVMNWRYWDSALWQRPIQLAQVPAVAMLIGVFIWVSESPSWLMAKGLVAKANAAAHQLNIAVPDELASGSEHDEEGQSSDASENKASRGSFWTMVSDPSGRRRLLIGAGLGVSQQLTGINAVIFFGPALVADVLRLSGSSAPFKAAALVGAANCLASLFSMGLIERFGRRQLLLSASPFLVASLGVLGMMRDGLLPRFPPLGVGALLMFICAFATTYGPLPFVVASEIFPVRYKGVGMSTCSFVLSVSCLAVAASFLPMLQLGGGVYYVYAACVIAATVFVWKVVPETRDMTLEEIDSLLN